MTAIWKYEIAPVDEQFIQVVQGAQALTVQMQHGRPCLWVLVQDTEAPHVSRRIVVKGTGHHFDADRLTYINSIQMYEGDLVFHVFDGGEA